MLLTSDQIDDVYSRLIAGTLSREDADRWAYVRMRACDAGELEFQPPSDEEMLWSALQYLYGIDIQHAPGDYLHSIEDIKRKKL